MAPIIERLLSLFSIPQGNLIYALVLLICSFSAWLACIYARGENETTPAKRMQLGLLFLFVTQLLLFAVSWMAWLGVINGQAYLPPLERTLALFSLVLVIWLWAFPEPSRVWDSLTALIEVFILLFGVTGLALWLRQGAITPFGTSILGEYAYYSGLALVIIGLIILPVRKPSQLIYGFLMLLVYLVGYVAESFFYQSAANYASLVHLGEMVAFLFLLLLPKRLVSPAAVVETTVEGSSDVTRLDGKLIQSIADVVTEPSPDVYYQELTRLVTQLMNAEYCLLMIPPKSGEQLIVPVGYSRPLARLIEGFTADGRNMPSILEAVKKGNSLRLSSTSGSDVRNLATEVGMSQPTHLVLVPFQPKGASTLMGIGLLSKPAAPAWSDADARRVKELTDTLLANLGRARIAVRASGQDEMMDKLQRAEARVDKARLEYAQLKAKFDSLTSQMTASESGSETEKALQEDLQRLEKRNKELETMLARGRPSMEEVEQLRLELRAALGDLARIPSTLSRSDQKMLETQLSAVKSLDKMQPTELVNSIAQEFRQPISSIVGYTDLLLGESVGLLGAVQRKFLERVKASTERMGILVNELVEVVTINGGKVDKSPVSVEIEPVIHEAVGNITAQMTEKNINIQLILPQSLPSISANKDALLQILENLLENACLVTPLDGTIRLSAEVEPHPGEQDFIHLSVSDQGGGIESTDVSRVFLRRYKTENPQIKGVGDMGVGLSIVKSLVELLKGRVWVDSQASGATFSVLLPLADGQVNPAQLKISSS